MRDIADIALPVGFEPQQEQPQTKCAAQPVFMYFFGVYGSLWASKFSTGLKDDRGHDKGVRVAMGVWRAELERYDPATVEMALRRWTSENTDKPPHLSQFLAMCAAVDKSMWRAGLVALPYEPPARAAVSLEPLRDGRDWARKILAGIAAGDKRTVTLRKMAMDALGIKEIEKAGV